MSFSSSTNLLSFSIPSSAISNANSNSNRYVLNITKGFSNPSSAPYSYDTFSVDFQNAYSFSIDYVSVTDSS